MDALVIGTQRQRKHLKKLQRNSLVMLKIQRFLFIYASYFPKINNFQPIIGFKLPFLS